MAPPHTPSKKQCKLTDFLNNPPPNRLDLSRILGSPVKKRRPGPKVRGLGERQQLPRTTAQLEPAPLQASRHGVGGPHQFLDPTINEVALLNIFNIARQRQKESVTISLNTNSEAEGEVKTRCSYTREQKLEAIRYATAQYKSGYDGSLHQMTRYAAAKKLGVHEKALKLWIDTRKEIEESKKGTRHNKKIFYAQEPILEDKLTALFKTQQDIGR